MMCTWQNSSSQTIENIMGILPEECDTTKQHEEESTGFFSTSSMTLTWWCLVSGCNSRNLRSPSHQPAQQLTTPQADKVETKPFKLKPKTSLPSF